MLLILQQMIDLTIRDFDTMVQEQYLQNTIPSATVLMFTPHCWLYAPRIDCWEAEKNLKTTPGSDCALNTLAIDEPLEYAKLYLDGNLQMWSECGRLIRYFLIFKQIKQFKIAY